MSPLTITHHDTGTGPVLHVAGELDYDQASALRERVERLDLHAGQKLIIDLSGLEYCDSTGLTALLAARQYASAANADTVLTAVPADTLRILTITGLDQVFIIHTGTDATPR
ncbi:anti-sigma factor antagonist [Streptomyces sp. SID685]|uniref:STAS domain-containing protein n=1 Tax=Streptomyces TaxID=1883 RepID=UPI00136D7F9F|nr:STAS domain-containing protein [Streptomyces sp. SID685]MYR87210.1 anti-sigma factor antagonist [Streptomyces sp. SID685]